MVNDKFDIQGVNSTRISLLIYLINNNKDNTSVELFHYNTVQVIYNDNIDILKTDTNKSNISSNLGKIDTSKSNISSNLGKINTNKNSIEDNDADIAYNLREINKIKKTKTYLKNIYNILFYDSKTQVDFKGIFFQKVFEVNTNKNDFMEMNFKIDLQYEDISERNYVKIIYEIFDNNNNNNSLYIKSTNNNKYSYFSNKVIIDVNIFYNFTKDIEKIKFVIKFQILLPRDIKIWYIKNENYRLIIKNYGL